MTVSGVVSADSHIDLGWLPEDTFTSRVGPTWRERVPQVVDTMDGPRWVADGVELSGVRAVGSRSRPYSEGRWLRADAMAATGLYTDGRSRPTNPDERWRDQDRDGVSAEVMYGLNGLNVALLDPDLVSVIFACYNDWLAGFCAVRPDRYYGLACLPTGSAEAAAAEIRRTTEMGLHGGVLDIKNGFRPMWHADWDPVWETAQALDYPISFHLGMKAGRQSPIIGRFDLPDREGLINSAVRMSLLQFQGAADYFGIIFGAALDRFPDLKIVLGESGIGWIPSMLDRMDWQYDNEFRDLGLEMRPSDYWHRQMYATFQSDAAGLALLDRLGAGHVMFASDYPHPDGTWPNSREFIERETAGISEEDRRAILHDNALRIYDPNRPVEAVA